MATKTLYLFIILIVGISLILNLAGLYTMSGSFMKDFIDPSRTPDERIDALYSSDFYDTIFNTTTGLLALIAGGTVILIGVITRGISDLPISASFGVVLALFVGEFISILRLISSESEVFGYIAYVIALPMVFILALSIYDWVRGRD